MPYMFLASSVICVALASILGAAFNKKNTDKRSPTTLYNLVYCIAAFIGWAVLYATDPSFDIAVLPYSLGFGLCYALCNIGLINALRTGPVSLTSLLLQLSLIGTTIWGFFFWETKFSILTGIGLALVVIALWLCLYTKSNKNQRNKISLKWLIFAAMSFAGNAGCAIIQRTQQQQFENKHGNMLMLFALAFSTVFCLIHYLVCDKSDTKKILKSSSVFPIVSGLANFVSNLCIILLASTTLSPGIIYPVLAVGSLSLTSLFSLVIFKEKLHPMQWIGMAVGTVAVVLLSI